MSIIQSEGLKAKKALNTRIVGHHCSFEQSGRAGASTVEVWGAGTPHRELLFSYDLADARVLLINLQSDVCRWLDVHRLHALFWQQKTSLEEGNPT